MAIYCNIHHNKPAKMLCKECGFLCEEHEQSEGDKNHTALFINAKIKELYGLMALQDEIKFMINTIQQYRVDIASLLEAKENNLLQQRNKLTQDIAKISKDPSIADIKNISGLFKRSMVFNTQDKAVAIVKDTNDKIKESILEILKDVVIIKEDSKQYYLSVKKKDTVNDLKKKITSMKQSSFYSMDPTTFRLCFNDIILIESYNIKCYHDLYDYSQLNLEKFDFQIYFRSMQRCQYAINVRRTDTISKILNAVVSTEKIFNLRDVELYCNGHKLANKDTLADSNIVPDDVILVVILFRWQYHVVEVLDITFNLIIIISPTCILEPLFYRNKINPLCA